MFSSSGPVIRDQDVLLADTLLKQSRFLGVWRERWVVVTKQFICSYAYPGEERVGKTPTEFLAIRDCATIRSAEDETGKPNCFRVDSTSRTLFLVAHSKEQKELWVGVIGRAMVRGSVVCED